MSRLPGSQGKIRGALDGGGPVSRELDPAGRGMAGSGVSRGESHVSVGVLCVGLYQPPEGGCGLGDSYIQEPGTGETGIQRQLLGKLSV